MFSNILQKLVPNRNINDLLPLEKLSYSFSEFTTQHLQDCLKKYTSLLDVVTSVFQDITNVKQEIIYYLSDASNRILINKSEDEILVFGVPLLLSYVLLYFIYENAECVSTLDISSIFINYLEYNIKFHGEKRRNISNNTAYTPTAIDGIVSILGACLIKHNKFSSFDKLCTFVTKKGTSITNEVLLRIIEHLSKQESYSNTLCVCTTKFFQSAPKKLIQNIKTSPLYSSKEINVQYLLFSALKGNKVSITNLFLQNMQDICLSNSELRTSKNLNQYKQMYTKIRSNFKKAKLENYFSENMDSLLVESLNRSVTVQTDDFEVLDLVEIAEIICFSLVFGTQSISQSIQNVLLILFRTFFEATVTEQTKFTDEFDANYLINLIFVSLFPLNNEFFHLLVHIDDKTNLNLLSFYFQLLYTSKSCVLTQPNLMSTYKELLANQKDRLLNVITRCESIITSRPSKKASLLENASEECTQALTVVGHIFGFFGLVTACQLFNFSLSLAEPQFFHNNYLKHSKFWIVQSLQTVRAFLDINDTRALLIPENQKIKVLIDNPENSQQTKFFLTTVYESIFKTICQYLILPEDADQLDNLVGEIFTLTINYDTVNLSCNYFLDMFVLHRLFRQNNDLLVTKSTWLNILNWALHIYQQIVVSDALDIKNKLQNLIFYISSIIPNVNLLDIISKFLVFALQFNDSYYLNIATEILENDNIPDEIIHKTACIIPTALSKFKQLFPADPNAKGWLGVAGAGVHLQSRIATCSFDLVVPLVDILIETQTEANTTIYKTKLVVVDKVIDIIHKFLSQNKPLSNELKAKLLLFIVRHALVDASVKLCDLASVSRRRARRVLLKIMSIIDLLQESDPYLLEDFMKVLYAGISSDILMLARKGFLKAAEIAITEPFKSLKPHHRQDLENIICIAKPSLYNVDKQSSYSVSKLTSSTSKKSSYIATRYKSTKY